MVLACSPQACFADTFFVAKESIQTVLPILSLMLKEHRFANTFFDAKER